MGAREDYEGADRRVKAIEERLNHPKFSALPLESREFLKRAHTAASSHAQKSADAYMLGGDAVAQMSAPDPMDKIKPETEVLDSAGKPTGIKLDAPPDAEFLPNVERTNSVRLEGKDETGWLEPPKRPGEDQQTYEDRVEQKWTDDFKVAKAKGKGLVREEKANTEWYDKASQGTRKFLRSGAAGAADALTAGLLPKAAGVLSDTIKGDPNGTFMEQHQDELALSPAGNLIGSVAGFGGIGALLDKGGRAVAGKALAGKASPQMGNFVGQAAGGAIGGAGLGLVEAGGDAAQQYYEGQGPNFSGDKAIMYGGIGGLLGIGGYGIGRVGDRMNKNYRSGSAHARDVRVQEKAEGRPSTSMISGHTRGPKFKAAEEEARALGEKEGVVIGAREMTALKGAKPLREDLQGKIDEQAKSIAEEKEAFFKGSEPRAHAEPYEDAPGRGLETAQNEGATTKVDEDGVQQMARLVNKLGGRQIKIPKGDKTQLSPGNDQATRPFGPGEMPAGRPRAEFTTDVMGGKEKRQMMRDGMPTLRVAEAPPRRKDQTLPSPMDEIHGRGLETPRDLGGEATSDVPPGFYQEFPEGLDAKQRWQAYSNRLAGKPDDAPNAHPYPESIPPHDMGGSAGEGQGNVFLPVGGEVKRMLKKEAELLVGTGSNNVLESMERRISDIQDARGLDNVIKNIQSKVNYETKGDSPVDKALKRVAHKAKELRKEWPGYYEMMERHEKATEEMNTLLQRLGVTPGKNHLDENDLRGLMGKMGPIGSGEDLLSQQAISGGKFRPEVMQGAEQTANLEATQRLTGRTDPDIGMNATPGMMPRLFAHSRNIVQGPHPRIDAAARHASKLERMPNGLPAGLSSSLLQAMQWDGMPLAEANPKNKLQYRINTKKKKEKE